jgi:pimeloyl-ACP methyl ester carboxylesterase
MTLTSPSTSTDPIDPAESGSGPEREAPAHVDPAELATITHRALVVFADDDLMTLRHAVDMFDALPNAELAVVPGTSHFLTQEKPHLVNALLLDFLTNEPVPTVAPIRRASRPR